MFSTFSSSVTDLYGQTVVSDGTAMITASYSNGTGAVNFYLDGITDGSGYCSFGGSTGIGRRVLVFLEQIMRMYLSTPWIMVAEFFSGID